MSYLIKIKPKPIKEKMTKEIGVSVIEYIELTINNIKLIENKKNGNLLLSTLKVRANKDSVQNINMIKYTKETLEINTQQVIMFNSIKQQIKRKITDSLFDIKINLA